VSARWDRGGPGPGDGVPLVLHVIPTATARGAQREARALATRLDAPGTRHHRLLSLFAGPRQVPVDIALDHPGGDRAAQGFDPRLVIGLRALLRRTGPSVVVAHGGDPLKYLVPATLGSRRPLAYYATGTFEHASSPARVALWRWLMGRADVVAAEGHDPAEFYPPQRRIDPREPVLAFVGAFSPGKRPGRFVEVVRELRKDDVALRAFMCGDGALVSEVAGPAAAAGVELLGSRSDVAAVLREADVFVFPSLPTGEGMPGVLIEAGMSGLPVVATAVPGVRTIVEDGTSGFVVDVDDLDSMVQVTKRLLVMPGLRRAMGDAGRKRCEQRFSLDAVAACWLSFLEPLVARSARRTRRAAG